MKKISILLVLLVAIAASSLMAWTTLTPITFGVAPEGKTDSAKADTFGYNSIAATSTRLDFYWKNTSTHHKPLCSLVVFLRQGTARDSMITIRRCIKAIADSTDSVHQYTIYPDSQNIKQWKAIFFSARDSTYNYLYTRER